MIVVGWDPSLAHWGWCAANWDRRDGRLRAVLAAGVVVTAPAREHDDQGAMADATRRGAALAAGLAQVLRDYRPEVVAVEATGGAMNYSAAYGFGVVAGVAGALRLGFGLSLRFVTPSDVKRVAGGSGRAEKADVRRGALARWPELQALVAGVVAGQREHAYDAAGALLALEEVGI